MSLLFSVLKAAHANGTHHQLALDALNRLECPDDAKWRRVFLKHIALYLEGSKAPDKEFKDFKNHVLHVRQNCWGGAREKAAAWQAKLAESLASERWDEAVYCAGILSHYVTDPVMPFHTGQTEAENNIHRATEWTISKSYSELARMANEICADHVVAVPKGDDWVATLVRQGAEFANQDYERLIGHYNFDLGVVHPEDGLDIHGQRLVARCLRHAALTYAAILSRTITDAAMTPPHVRLTVQSAVAGLKIPLRWVLRKMEDAGERRLIEQIYDEWKETGQVEQSLPEDDRAVRDLYRADFGDATQPALTAARPAATARHERPKETRAAQENGKQTIVRPVKIDARAILGPESTSDGRGAKSAEADPVRDTDKNQPHDGTAKHREKRDNRRRGNLLKRRDDVEDAPSIGRKTAKRLHKIGVRTVGDLLDTTPQYIAERLRLSYVDVEVAMDWQAQARLRTEIAGLKGYQAQLLAAAGYHTASALANAGPPAVFAALGRVLETDEGQRYLRDGPMPTVGDVNAWHNGALEALGVSEAASPRGAQAAAG